MKLQVLLVLLATACPGVNDKKPKHENAERKNEEDALDWDKNFRRNTSRRNGMVPEPY